MINTTIKLAADTHVGYVRSNNEDNFILCSNFDSADWHSQKTALEVNLDEYGVLAVVADGMGGMSAGEVASAITIDTIENQFTLERIKKVCDSEEQILQLMEETVSVANHNILNNSNVHPETYGMGTTVVMAWIINGKAYICWCGDSRCYVYNDNSGLIQLSHDHSYVQELVDMGQLDPENMHNHPYANIITHCLGDAGNVAQPDCHVYNMNDGDIIMLCSDGLTTMCRDQEIEQIMKEHDPAVCCENLISSALKRGGYDNVTIALCEYRTEQG